ncbi:MAG TPA: metalloregulator ArsR/SmtB family transcription factor [Acidimicrobiales bacterium]|nr:metalloregulator ArsR/SmtB family transcription factor [Acidimicrobiales bacterium]
MHLVPPGRSTDRIIEVERVCDAIGGIGDPASVAEEAGRFALLGDPTRLTLLLAIYHAGPISVSDLAVAGGMHDTTVSQALRILRAANMVKAIRDGRVVRYQLADDRIGELLERVSPRSDLRHSAAH